MHGNGNIGHDGDEVEFEIIFCVSLPGCLILKNQYIVAVLYFFDILMFYVTCSVMFRHLHVETSAELQQRNSQASDFKEVGLGHIRRQAALLTDEDARYAGRRVSRKDFEDEVSAAGV